jgi:hypothetical protein
LVVVVVIGRFIVDYAIEKWRQCKNKQRMNYQQ